MPPCPGQGPLQGERYGEWYTPGAQPPVGRRRRATSTTLTLLGGELGPALHVSDIVRKPL